MPATDLVTPATGWTMLKETVETTINHFMKSHWLPLKWRQIERADLESHAYEGFLDAWHSYTPERGASLKTHVVNKIRFRLRDLLRQSRRPDPLADKRPIISERFDAAGFLREISDDARIVCQLILEELPAGRGIDTRRKQFVLVRMLKGMGWCGRRIAKSFRELKEVLSLV